MKCWLCQDGTNLDDGGLQPGEMSINFFGDPECIYCAQKINTMVKLMERPELIPLIAAIKKLPKVAGVSIGIRFDDEEMI